MRKLLIFGAGLLLTACQHTQPAVEIRTVEVPVPGPCIPADQIEPEPAPIGHLLGRVPETAEADRDILAAQVLRLLAWGRPMHTALTECAD